MRLGLLIPVLALTACGTGNGQQMASSAAGGSTRSYDVGDFDKVALEGASQVVIRTGIATSVRAEGDAEVLDHLDIAVRGDTLTIGNKRKRGLDLDFSGSRGRSKVFITLPVLSEVAVGGSGKIEVDKVDGDSFEGSISGSGDLRIDSLRVRSAAFSVAGSGDVDAAGAAESLALNIAGSGDLNFGNVESRTLSVSIAGSGSARTRATDSANVSIMGSGDVTVSGPARCTVSKAGSGTVRCNA